MNRRLLAIYAAIIVTSLLSFYLPLHHQRPSEYTPQQIHKEAAPRSQPGVVSPNSNEAQPPVLQQGVDPVQATQLFEISSLENIPAFDKTEFTVRTTDIIGLTFRNNSSPSLHYRHAWVLVRPGRAEAVQIAANRAGPENQFMPDTPDVLARTSRLLKAGESEAIYFHAPSEPGDYPFLCPFPGHGAAMRGILHVKAP